jgi:hypothetical protein
MLSVLDDGVVLILDGTTSHIQSSSGVKAGFQKIFRNPTPFGLLTHSILVIMVQAREVGFISVSRLAKSFFAESFFMVLFFCKV